MPHRRYAAVRSRLTVGAALTVAMLMGAVGLWTPADAAGTAYFVAPNGADTNSGTSAATPFKTIQKALDKAQPGTTITLAAGTYKEAVATKVAGTAGAPITVKGPETGKAASGRYRAVLVSPAGRAFSINHSYYTLDGFTIDGQPNIARTAYPTALDKARSFKDGVQTKAVNSKLIYVGASTTSADIVGTTISNMFLTGSGGECVRFRNRAADSTIVDSVIQWCGMLGQGDDKDQYKYHNAEGVYVGTSLVSTDQPMAANDSSNNIVVRNSTINTFGSECFEVKENAHHNRLENSDCGFNDEPLSFKGSNIELRGDHNLVLNSRVGPSRSWNVKLWSDAAAYDRGGNSLQKSSFSGAAGPAISNKQTANETVFCGNTFATSPVAEGLTVDPKQACADTPSTTAPTTAPTIPPTTVPTTAPPTTAPTTAPITVPPTTTAPAVAQPVVVEAESAAVTSPMAVRTDGAAQGGRYVSQTSGSTAGKVTAQLTVRTAGRYAVALRVQAPNSSSDSFVVKVGSGSSTTWNLGIRTSWTWVTGQTIVQLPAGTTTVVVTNRENGARLDAVRLTPAP